MDEPNKTYGVNWWKVGGIIAAILLIFGFGFYLGKKRDPEVIIKTEIKYVELPPIHDTVDKPVPVYIKKPADSLNILQAMIASGKYNEYFPEKVRDSIIYVTKEDSTAVIVDWATERQYNEVLFDTDTLGRFVFDAKVQYNRLQGVGYDYKPVQKEVNTTTKTTRKFLPYLGAGVDTSGGILGQGGMFFSQDAGFAVQYRYDLNLKTNTVGAMFLYMF
jgi:hypothetical protein